MAGPKRARTADLRFLHTGESGQLETGYRCCFQHAPPRTQEIGIRIALGATLNDVQLLIFRQGFASVALGLAIGIAAAVPLLRLLQGSLVGFESRHAASLYVAVAVVLVTAGFACWL